MELLQIGEVSARTELSIKTIRHYDDVGLVVPSARSYGWNSGEVRGRTTCDTSHAGSRSMK